MRNFPISLILFILAALFLAATAVAAPANKLMDVKFQNSANKPEITLQTESPVGYRYTVYDSFDPVRVVVDFPGMDVSAIQKNLDIKDSNLRQVRVTSFDLESGKLGRVEILLNKSTNYEVTLKDTAFNITFEPTEAVASIGKALGSQSTEKKPTVASPPAPAPAVPVVSKPTAGSVKTSESRVEPVKQSVVNVNKAASGNAAVEQSAIAKSVSGGVMFAGPENQKAKISATRMLRYQYFRLAGPPRLVLDIYGVKPGFSQRTFNAEKGFDRVRVGVYADKTRFVFDGEGPALPAFEVARDGDAIVVDWSGNAIAATSPTQPEAVPAGNITSATNPVAIEGLDFDGNDGQSTFVIKMSGPGRLIEPVQTGDVIRFGVANATISRSLRRVVDASSFPSAVKLITPYIVQNKAGQEVRFAAELKGPVGYSVKKQGNEIIFMTEDGAFAEVIPPSPETLAVPVSPNAVAASTNSQELAETIAAVRAEVEPTQVAQTVVEEGLTSQQLLGAEEGKVYSGQKISLVFDNADIRQILQLIGEVAELNIIASDEVKGTVTLRLLDVPWDQALDLIMDIKDLGMLKQGNVARVLPRSRIRSMEEAKMTAVRTKEKLQDLVTQVIMVSHASLENVAGPAAELLSERGKITPDPRNKQIIVTDIPTVIDDIKQLVAILDTPERQVLIESRIVEASSNFSRDLGVNWGYSYNQNKEYPNLTDGKVGMGGSFVIDPTVVAGGAASGFGSSFTFGRLGVDSSVLNLKISALETTGQGKVISAPRIATLNGEAAMISQGTKIPYQSVSDQGTETKFENAELRLEVTPVINPDDSVILEIVASNSSVGATVPTGVGDAIAIDEKKAETKVLVNDGETTVIGGIFVEDERYSESGVPFLKDLPIIGDLAKSTTKTSERKELLIFITPRIVQ